MTVDLATTRTVLAVHTRTNIDGRWTANIDYLTPTEYSATAMGELQALAVQSIREAMPAGDRADRLRVKWTVCGPGPTYGPHVVGIRVIEFVEV